MKTQPAKEGLAARQAELPKQSVRLCDEHACERDENSRLHRQLIPPLLLHAKQFLDVNGVVNKIFYKKGDDAKVDALVARANGSLARFAGAAAQTQQPRQIRISTSPTSPTIRTLWRKRCWPTFTNS